MSFQQQLGHQELRLKDIHMEMNQFTQNNTKLEFLHLNNIDSNIKNIFTHKQFVGQQNILNSDYNDTLSSNDIFHNPELNRLKNIKTEYLNNMITGIQKSSNDLNNLNAHILSSYVNKSFPEILQISHSKKIQNQNLNYFINQKEVVEEFLLSFNSEPTQEESLEFKITPNFKFWENINHKNIIMKDLVIERDKMNVLTPNIDRWLKDRMDEHSLDYFNKCIPLYSEKTFIDNLIMGIQGLPNSLFDIQWTLVQPDNTIIESTQIDLSNPSNTELDFLTNINVKPLLHLKQFQIENYSLNSSNLLIKSLKPKIERLLRMFQLVQNKHHMIISADYFEVELRNKVYQLMTSFFSYRLIDLPNNSLLQFITKFGKFQKEMDNLIDFLQLTSRSNQSFLKNCHILQSILLKQSIFFQWIEK